MRKYFLFIVSIICFLCLLCGCKSKEVTVAYIAEDGGNVYGESLQTIEVGESCTQVYAVAESGYRFTGWSDGISSSQRLDTEVKESVTLTAQFEKIEYVEVKYIAEDGGNVYGELLQTIEVGESCTQVYAVAGSGYRFTGWSDGISSSQRLDTEVEESVTLTAQFEKIEYVEVKYVAEDGGNVYGESLQTIEVGESCTQVYAVAGGGYRFTGWSDGISSSQRLDTEVKESVTLTAQFEKIEYVEVKYIAEDGGNVYGESLQTIEVGESCTQVYAVAESGYRFTGWSDGISSSQRLDTEVKESVTLTAQFEKIEYVEVKYIAEDGGNVYGESLQTIEVGESCTQVYAVAESGYRFTGWSDGISSSQRLDTEVEESVTLTAQFEDVYVLFYSDDLLVRKYTLNEFKTVDTTKVVGYSSFKEFIGWEFTGVYSGYDTGSPLTLINTYFVNMRDLFDITLSAVYMDIDEQVDVPSISKTIAHAMGGFDNVDYLNSKEAFEFNYEQGFRLFEADLALTTDGYIVLDRNRGEYTYDTFMQRATEWYTPLSLEDLLNYMVLYPEIWVDWDTLGFTDAESNTFISSLKALFTTYSDETAESLINRIIVEITPYNESLIDLLKSEIGITNFLYTEGWYTNDLSVFEQTCNHCQELGIKYVSIKCDLLLNNGAAKVELLKQYNLYAFAYTTSDIDTMYKLYDIGVDCIFTDFTFI